MELALYEINKEIEKLIDEYVDIETGELLPEAEQRLDELQLARQEKIVNIGLFVKNINYYIETIKAEKKRLAFLEKTATNKLEFLKNYLKYNLEPGEKIQSPQLNISWRKSVSVEETDAFNIELIEKSFPNLIRIKKELDKMEAKKILKDVNIVGLKLVEKNNIQIK